jgi:sugar phosphate isomerase/epimerase
MSDRTALQLYSIRDVVAATNYESSVRKISDMGYKAVETAGFPGTTPGAAAKLFAELGITVVSAHVGLPLGDQKNEILDTMAALGNPRMLCSQIGPADVANLDTIKALCDKLNEGYEVASSNGLSYGIHNHWWEFGQINGRLIHHYMLDLLNPGIFFEIDTYWVKVAGSDPVDIVKSLGLRAPLLHIKDGPGIKEAAMTAVGGGIMDVQAILKAGGDNVKWLIVELDNCDGDIMTAVKQSYDYLATL